MVHSSRLDLLTTTKRSEPFYPLPHPAEAILRAPPAYAAQRTRKLMSMSAQRILRLHTHAATLKHALYHVFELFNCRAQVSVVFGVAEMTTSLTTASAVKIQSLAILVRSAERRRTKFTSRDEEERKKRKGTG